jgi:integrase
LLGLQWPDVDLQAGTISIRRSLSAVPAGEPEFSEPKTDRSRRTIQLPPDALAALQVQKDRQAWDRQKLGEDYTDYGLVFATALGTALMKRNVIRSFKTALARAGLPIAIRIHDLRHAHATVMRKAGVDMKTVSERLGHSSIAITAERVHTVIRRASLG